MSLSKLASDPRLYSLGVLILLFFGVLVPITIPLELDDWTSDFWDVMETLTEDDVVLVRFGMASRGDQWHPMLMVMEHLTRLNPKIIWFTTNQFAVTLNAEFIETVYGENWKQEVDYGNRFVYFGYQGDAITVNVLLDYNLVWSKDLYDTSVNNLPLMQEITGPSSFDMVLTLVGSEQDWSLDERGQIMARENDFYWLFAGDSQVAAGGGLGRWTAGYIHGLFAGNRSAVQYAAKLGVTTPSSKYVNPGLFISTFTAIMMILVNVKRLLRRKG